MIKTEKLPTLKGTELQTKWAKSLRTKRIEEIDALTIAQVLKTIRPHLKEGDLESINCLEELQILSFVQAICQHSVSCPEAKHWIENREKSFKDTIEHSYRECLTHFQQTQPFK